MTDHEDEPTFYLAGQHDLIVWPALVKAFYNDSDHLPAVYGELRGAGGAAWSRTRKRLSGSRTIATLVVAPPRPGRFRRPPRTLTA